MKNQWKAVVLVLACLALVFSVALISADTSKAAPAATQSSAQAQSQTVSGKVSAIGRSSFTLTLSSATINSTEQDSKHAKTMTFQVDSNTTIDGKLQVGANADVTYRDDNGTYVAINVRVTPAS